MAVFDEVVPTPGPPLQPPGQDVGPLMVDSVGNDVGMIDIADSDDDGGPAIPASPAVIESESNDDFGVRIDMAGAGAPVPPQDQPRADAPLLADGGEPLAALAPVARPAAGDPVHPAHPAQPAELPLQPFASVVPSSRGHKKICEILLPVLVKVLREDRWRNADKRNVLHKACLRSLFAERR